MRPSLPFVLALALVAATGCSKDARQYYESGNGYFAQQKYREAVVEYRNAIQKDPKLAEARLKLAESYEKLHDARNAYEQYVRAADLLPGNINAQLKAGSFLFLARQYKDASARADVVLKRDPKNVDALILKGDAAAMLQDLDGAIRQIEEAIQIDPESSRAYNDLGIMRKQQGDMPAAEQAFRRAVQVQPGSATAQLALANFFLQSGRSAEAETTLKTAHGLEPKGVLTNRALAAFYLASNRAAEAEPFLKTIAETTKDLGATLSLADYYVGTRRIPEAVSLLEKTSGTKEGFGPAKTRLAAVHYIEGRREQAHKTIDEVLARDAKDDRALVVKARFLLAEQKTDEALARLRSAIAANPRSASAQYLVGTVYAATNKPDEAVTAFNEVLKLNPRATAAQLQIARLELAKGRSGAAGAVQYAQQAVASQPGNPIARLMLVRSLMVKGDLAQAESELKTLSQQYPNAAPVTASLGALSLAKRDVAGARRAFDRALQQDKNSVEALAGLTAVDLASNKPAEARARVEARLASTPGDPAVLLLAARTYASTGDAARAEQTLLKTIETAPAQLQAYSLLGQLYLRQRKLAPARDKFEELARRQTKPVGAHTMVAMILQLEGRQADAQKRYEKVLEIDPRAPVAANNLAWMYAEGAGNLDVALQLAQTAKAGLPEAPEVNDTLGWIYCKKGMGPPAVSALQQAVEKEPRNPAYRYHLGVAYAKAGDRTRAKAEIEEALKLSPAFDGVAEARALLSTLE